MKKISIILILVLVVIFILFFLFFPLGDKREGREREMAKVLGEEGEEEEVKQSETDKKSFDDCSISSCIFFPIRDETKPLLELGEKAGIAVLFTSHGEKEILYQKNIDEELPIASLTKIMTAMIVVDHYDLDDIITVSKDAVLTEGESGRLSPGEQMSVEGLLDLSLLVSSNDAVSALVEKMGEEKFIRLMNEEMERIGLYKIHFKNAHGLDEKDHNNNTASVYELALMTEYSMLQYPLVWDILGTVEKDVYGSNGLGQSIHHHPRNVSRKLLEEEGVIGGKTGYTEDAVETMILTMEAPGIVEGNIVIVILGVGIGERIQKAKQAYNWLNTAYIWE